MKANKFATRRPKNLWSEMDLQISIEDPPPRAGNRNSKTTSVSFRPVRLLKKKGKATAFVVIDNK
jgi:hypothetical protein